MLDRSLLLFLDSIEAMILENLRQERMACVFVSDSGGLIPNDCFDILLPFFLYKRVKK